MAKVANITISRSLAGNKKLTPDADGYYRVIFGAYNVLSTRGDVHLADGLKEALEDKGNILNRRLVPGRLRSEADHPEYEPGMTKEQFILRNINIDPGRVCAHIKEVRYIETDEPSGVPGVGNVVLIEGLVRPSGVMSKGLADSLANPHEDTCFSVRSITDDVFRNGRYYKKIKQIITWDWVNEPGIKYASKLNGLTVESMDVGACYMEDLINIKEDLMDREVTTESEAQLDMVTELINSTPSTDIISRW